MLSIEPKREKQQKQTIHPLVVGVAGMIAGATAVTAIALTDEDIRKKAVKRAREAKKKLQTWSDGKLHEYKDKIKNHEEIGEEFTEELNANSKEIKQASEEKINN